MNIDSIRWLRRIDNINNNKDYIVNSNEDHLVSQGLAGNDNSNDNSNNTCRNTLQGRTLIADDRGTTTLKVLS